MIIGIGAAGTVLMIFRVFGRRAPRWVIPTAVGLAMFGFQIWNGYTWHQRTADGLPDGVRMVKTYPHRSPFSPWTYIVPQVNRFVALDFASVQRNRKAPDLALATIYLFDRYQPAGKGMQIFDCGKARRADLGPTAKFGNNGLPENAMWVAVDGNDVILRAVCDAE